MNVKAVPTSAALARNPHAINAPSPPLRPGPRDIDAKPGFDRDAPDQSSVADVSAQDLALWANLCAPPPATDMEADDAGTRWSASMPGDASIMQAPLNAMEQLTTELRALVEAGSGEGLDSCSFEVDLPGLGRLQGRMTVSRNRADLELHGLTPSLAAALRMKREALQQSVGQAIDGDLNLFIV